MSNISFEFTFDVPRSPVKRFLLKQLIKYAGFFITSVFLAVWAAAILMIVSLYSQNATIMVLDLLVTWGGDFFAPLKEGGKLVFSTDSADMGPNDISGVDAVMYLSGWVSLGLYALGALYDAIGWKKVSITREAKTRFVRRFSLAGFIIILLSGFFRFESGVAPDSFFASLILGIFVAPGLLISGYGWVIGNAQVGKALDHVDNAASEFGT